ncbi:MAG: T9SS type A sorting domain-containing protein [Chitinophagaceae bacterium]|nr:MAG: T9SS type A sorting domain-containing protein [Chitinophagaceae bacterium]
MKKPLLIVLLLSAGTAMAQIPSNGLLGHYPLAGNANDISGNGQNGTVFGATPTTDRFGNPDAAMSFDGMDDYISLPPAGFVGLNEYSYSVWAKPYSAQGGMIVSFGSDYDNDDQTISYRPDKSWWAGSHNVGTNPIQSQAVLNNQEPDEWYHVVFTRSVSEVKFYVNGVQTQSLPTYLTNGQMAAYGNSWRAVVGVRAQGTGYFHGAIGGLRAYDHPLTSAEVQTLYNETVTSAEKELAPNTFKLYPNPANGYFTVGCANSDILLGASVVIENSLGKTIQHSRITEANQRVMIPTEAKGVYFVRVIGLDGSQIHAGKLINQ